MADVSDLPVILVRGESPSQGWIEVVHLAPSASKAETVILDLLYNPGTFLAKTSPLGEQYTQPPNLPRAAGTVAPRSNFSTRDIRPLLGVMSQARQQLQQINAPRRCSKDEPTREIPMRSGREKWRLFQLTRVFDGRTSSGKARYRPRLIKLFRCFITRGVQLQRRTILLKATARSDHTALAK